MRILIFHVILWVACCLANSLFAQVDYMKQWPQFRGPFACGIIDSTDLPEKWDIQTGENIKWKITIPGLGHSCPVIWDDNLFVTTAISASGTDSLKVGLYGDTDNVKDDSVHEFRVFCIDKNSGQIRWERMAHKGIPKTKRHTKSSHANPTAATNGKYVVFFFGSEGLYCYDFEGDLIWKKDFGKMNAGPYDEPDVEWGFASSPIIHENKVIVQCDFTGDGFITALNVETGEELWRTPRDEISTWCTPNFYNDGNIKHIIANGYNHIGGYDFNTGEEVWKLSGGGDAPVPTPVFAHGFIYIHNAHGRKSPIYAINPDATGDITLDSDSTSNENVVWSIKRGGAYMPTVVVYGDYLYNMRMNGQLSCFDARTGELIFKEKIPDARGITASAIASDGKLYYATEQGDVYIVKADTTFEILAKNTLNDVIMATPAISGNMLFFRTQHYLIAIGK